MNQSPENNSDVNSQKKQEIDANTLELVKSIFLEVSDNQDIPEAFRTILAQLFDRYLAIALSTPNLFAIENHQARVFLKETCGFCIKWKNEEDNNNLYLKKLKSVVEKIITKEEYDSKIFINYQNDLDKVLIKLRKRAKIKIKRLKEKLLGQEKIEKAKKSTTLALKDLLVDSKVPKFVKNIIEGEWMNVLVLLHIRHGIASSEYQSKLDFVDMLIESLKLTRENAKQKLKILTQKYRDGLDLVAFNQQEISSKQKELIANITRLYQKNTNNNTVKSEVVKPEITKPEFIESDIVQSAIVKPEIVVSEIVEKEVTKPETIQKQAEIAKESKRPKASKQGEKTLNEKVPKTPKKIEKKAENIIDYANIVASLKTGTWFEMIDKDKNRVKAKLSWISPITGNLLFVNSQGLKITDKTSAELEKELKSQTFKILTVID